MGGIACASSNRHQHSDQAGSEGEDQGLDQKLKGDVAIARAQRLAQSHFLGALGHADQHDVHHADAADAERQHADESEDQPQSDSELFEYLWRRRRCPTRELDLSSLGLKL